MIGFGLARPMVEGSPLHPEDMWCNSQDHYDRQMAAYKEWLKTSEPDRFREEFPNEK